MAIPKDSRAVYDQWRLHKEFARANAEARQYAEQQSMACAQQQILDQERKAGEAYRNMMAMGLPREYLNPQGIAHSGYREGPSDPLGSSTPKLRQMYYDELRKQFRYRDIPPPLGSDEAYKKCVGRDSVRRALGLKPKEPDLDRDGVLVYLTKRKNDWLSGVRLPG